MHRLHSCLCDSSAWTASSIQEPASCIIHTVLMFRQYVIAIGYSKDGPKRKCEEKNDFHWLGERWGEEGLRLTSHPAIGSRFVLYISGLGLPWSTLFECHRPTCWRSEQHEWQQSIQEESTLPAPSWRLRWFIYWTRGTFAGRRSLHSNKFCMYSYDNRTAWSIPVLHAEPCVFPDDVAFCQ